MKDELHILAGRQDVVLVQQVPFEPFNVVPQRLSFIKNTDGSSLFR
jgi:hypothetical protein